MKRYIVSGSLLLMSLFTSINSWAVTITVSTIANLQTAINNASAGDIIILANNTYSNASITIGSNGLIIKAATPGGVIFNASSKCTITGNDNIFSGFQYVNGDVGSADMIQVYGNNNQITQCNFNGINAGKYVRIMGGASNNQITYCNFENKPGVLNAGPIVHISTSPTVLSKSKVRYCTFLNSLGSGGDFGNEPIRIGLGSEQNNVAACVVEYCYFENLGLGDGETISVKSTGNVLRFNTQNNNPQGSFSFRTGNNNSAYGNFFINSGGMRVKEGINHMIYNNYFQGTAINPSIELRNDGVVQPNTIYIYHNTFYNPAAITLNAGGSSNIPLNVSLVNNIFFKTTGSIFSDANSNTSYTNNEYFGGASLGISNTNANQFININPLLTLNSYGYYALSATSPGINNSNGTYSSIIDNPNVDDDPNLLFDIEGQSRPVDKTQKDMGCDEYTGGVVTNKPLARCDAGPSYLCTTVPVKLTSFIAIKQTRSNQLIWKTETEINNKGYYIQRSGLNNSFETIDFIQANKNGFSYEFTDQSPFTYSKYRLIQVDEDGRETFSNIISVNRGTSNSFVVYPNPVKDEVVIETPTGFNSPYSIVIKDLQGKVIISSSKNNLSTKMNLSNLVKGFYFIELATADECIKCTQKIIKL